MDVDVARVADRGHAHAPAHDAGRATLTVSVDPGTLATAYPGVFAVGDLVSLVGAPDELDRGLARDHVERVARAQPAHGDHGRFVGVHIARDHGLQRHHQRGGERGDRCSRMEGVDDGGGERLVAGQHLRDGAPDYTAATFQRRHGELAAWQARLAAIAPESWPIAQQVDYQIVRAEMNGFDFYVRVLQPWVRDPAWYVSIWTAQSDTPAHEGPTNHAAIASHNRTMIGSHRRSTIAIACSTIGR